MSNNNNANSSNGVPGATDRVVGILALLLLTAFLGVIIRKVPHTDLIVVALIGIALAGFDFWEQLFRRKP